MSTGRKLVWAIILLGAFVSLQPPEEVGPYSLSNANMRKMGGQL